MCVCVCKRERERDHAIKDKDKCGRLPFISGPVVRIHLSVAGDSPQRRTIREEGRRDGSIKLISEPEEREQNQLV